jgi:hypothetical protein
MRLGALQWLAAWAVIGQAVLHRFAPDAGPWTLGLVFATLGALFVTSPVAPARRTAARLVGAASLAALGLALVGLHALAGGGTDLWGPPWIALLVLLLADRAAWSRLARLAAVEWLKTRRSRLFQAGLAATALATLLAGLAHEALPGETGWTLATAALGTGATAAQVILLVLGATALAGEATGGTMKMLLPHAYRRTDWILAKALVLLLVALCFAVVVAAVALGQAAATEGLGDVTREIEPMFGEETGTTETVQAASTMRSHLQETLLGGLAALGATALLGLFVSALFDGVVSALCVAFLLFAGLEFADVVLALPREALQDVYAWYPAEMRSLTGKLGRALSERWDAALFPEGLRLALLTGAASLLLATAGFARRDLHV